MGELAWLDDSLDFPKTSLALDDPDGLLAVGGDLSIPRLLAAYRRGIFPWYSEGQPILWWSPSPRTILIPDEFHLGRSNKKLLNKHAFSIKIDTAFAAVIEHCAGVARSEQDGTWIMDEIKEAYIALHHAGYAHSIEAWSGDRLVGGLYGVSLGKVFFGESMFSLESGASKVAFIHLVSALQHWDYQIIDCQIHTDYLASFGAREVSREVFEQNLDRAVQQPSINCWKENWPSQAINPGAQTRSNRTPNRD